ncbi:hypothetical protein [Alicyclobacillus ferrooxydans]|nr:hypothetical protein [Alicyclobacillus ferrooxydans]
MLCIHGKTNAPVAYMVNQNPSQMEQSSFEPFGGPQPPPWLTRDLPVQHE